ncbi:MAG TPA: hypothetical protein VK989_17100, partial [Polyangia bacterium]|nr:hypothetical protein [Polyangia bacterium]
KVKEQGGHDKLAAAAAAGAGHGKDKDYVTKLESFSNGRLVDMLTTADRRAKRKAGVKVAAPKAAAPKAKAKAPAAKRAKPAAK